jgi:hypothetical protein
LGLPLPLFFVSVADTGLKDLVNPLETTLTKRITSVDFKGLTVRHSGERQGNSNYNNYT